MDGGLYEKSARLATRVGSWMDAQVREYQFVYGRFPDAIRYVLEGAVMETEPGYGEYRMTFKMRLWCIGQRKREG